MNQAITIEHIEKAIAKAERRESKLTQEAMEVPGFTGKKVRHFLNNITDFSGCRYLEVGCYKGATLSSAMFKNEMGRWGIDNFSQFGGSKAVLSASVLKATGMEVNIIEADCFSVNTTQEGILSVNVYFFDGRHDRESQRMALEYYYQAMEGRFIFLVDDFDDKDVRGGTYRAISDIGPRVLFGRELRGGAGGDAEGWWNGIGVFLLEK